MWLQKPNFCSFVTATLGRPSLKRTIQSLLNQNSWNWLSYIIFDGASPIEIKGLNPDINYLNDNHFIVSKVDKLGHAGLVRNSVLDKIDTEWIAFVDDDDTLKETYIDKLIYYQNNNKDKDIIIFSYYDDINKNLQPPANLNYIKRCNVGISFAIKTKFVQNNNIKFIEGGIEDFEFLNDAVNKGANYLITHDVQYLVHGRGVWRY